MKDISVDSYTLLEHMVSSASEEDGTLLFKGTVGEACDRLGLKTHGKAMAAYTKDLKDAGILKLGHKQWYIDLSAAETTVVQGLDAKVSELLPSHAVVDLTVPAPVVKEESAPGIDVHPVTEGAPPVTLEEGLSQVSNVELAGAIARELFDRLDALAGELWSSEKRRLELEAKDNLRNDMSTELNELRTQLEAEVAARSAAELAKREAEREAVENKTQKERLEFQYAQMMKEIASASDGEEITAAARRFLRPSVDGARRVAAASVKPS